MTSNRQILMLTNAIAPDKLGGLERYVRELSAALVELGDSVTVATKRLDADLPSDEVGADGVRIMRHDVPSKKNPAFAALYPLAVARGTRQALRAYPDAIVHGHYAITTLPVAFMKRNYTYTFHAPVYKEVLSERQGSYLLPKPLMRSAVAGVRVGERRVVARSTSATTLSQFMLDELAELSPEAAKRTVVIPGGVDTDHFSPASEPRDEWASAASSLLFTARRFTARTGVQQLVEAMSRVVKHQPEARLVIAGDGRLRPDIEQSIEQLGLQHSIRLLGRINDADLRHWYRVADLTVMPTQELEGFGLTTAESMACGTPALVTPVGANAELVQGLDSRLVARGQAPDGMAQSILDLLVDPAALQGLRKPVRDHAVALWSWPTVGRRYQQLYDELAQGKARA